MPPSYDMIEAERAAANERLVKQVLLGMLAVVVISAIG